MSLPIGRCRLCLLDGRELEEGHFIPAGIYRISRDKEASNPNPALISPRLYVQSSKQLKEHLFCHDCENLLNDNGERWIISNCYRSAEGRFPLRERVQAAKPFLSMEGGLGFNTAGIGGIEHDRIVYFALSVYWRAAIQWWKIGRETIPPIDLGRYEEKIRSFLHGEKELDPNIYLSVWLSDRQQPLVVSSVPTSHHVGGGGIMHRMNIPGIAFVLTIGRNVSEEIEQTCMIHVAGRPIFVSPHVDDELVSNLVATVRANGVTKRPRE